LVILGKHDPLFSKSGNKLTLAGEHDLTTSQESVSLRIPAKPSGINRQWRYKARIEKDHTEQGVWYDFALLELSVPVNFTLSPHIRPVCLPDSVEVDYDDELATVSGWGHQKIRYLTQNQQGVVKGIGSKNAKRLQKLDVR
jgi:hypothetical protein